MGRAKNTLDAANVSSTPIKVKYAVSYPSSSLLDYGITTNRGINYPYTVGMLTASMDRMNNYRVVRQLYYQYSITGSLLNTASAWDPVWQSTAASSSGDNTVYKFPTELTSSVSILTIPSTQFGEQVSRKTFSIKSTDNTTYNIIDDGNGNLIDSASSNVHVGNIFSVQGVAVITNPDYVGILLDPYFSITVI